MLGQINYPYSYNYPAYYPAYIPEIPNNSGYSNLPNHQIQDYSLTEAQCMKNYAYPHIIFSAPMQTSEIQNNFDIPWITDPVIKEAVSKLKEVNYLPGDTEHMKNLGVNILYNNGTEAMQTIIERGLKIEFGQVNNDKVHAQLDNDNNLIQINEKYRNTNDPAVVLAISEAIFHELGHAKDKDNVSSIQEEIDCLALNTLANRYHQAYYPQVFNSTTNADIINDGVSLYTKLFFDSDPDKKALTDRIIEKYGNLNIESPNHKAPLCASISEKLNTLNKFKQM